MIPIKLSLKNFLSYGPTVQTVDFAPYHLICLNGKNGHGKSALLDAITWALWGQARKVTGTAKPDEQLLRLGQTQMMVTLECILNGKNYRIRREFSTTYGKPYSQLDFALIDDVTGKTVPLTDKTIKGTQAIIEKTVGLDYEAFINSSFLRQGQSNEFSKKTPKERKELLATILGLNRYEALRKLAVEKARTLTIRQEHLVHQQTQTELSLKNYEQLPQNLSQIEQMLKDLSLQEANIQTILQTLQTQKTSLQQEYTTYQMVVFQQSHLQNEYTTMSAELIKVFNQWRSVHHQALKSHQLQELSQEYEQLVTHIAQAQQAAQEQLRIKETILSLKQEEKNYLDKHTHEHTNLIAQKTLRIEHLTATLNAFTKQSHEISERISNFQQEFLTNQTVCNELEQQLTTVRQKISYHKAQEKTAQKRIVMYHNWVARGQALKAERLQLEQKKVFTQDIENPSCPLCEQNLSTARKRFLHAKLLKVQQFLDHRLKRLAMLVRTLKDILARDQQANSHSVQDQEIVTRLESQHAHLQKNQATLTSALAKEKKVYAALQQEIDTTKVAVDAEKQSIIAAQHKYAQFLEKDAHLINTRESIKKCEQMLIQSHKDTQQYTDLIKRLEEIQHQQNVLATVRQELAQQHTRAQTISSLCKNLKKRKQELMQLRIKVQSYETTTRQLKEVEREEQELAITLSALKSKRESLLQEKGKLEEQERSATEQQRLLQQLHEEKKKYQEEIEEYQSVAQALSKDGIQAILIEDALPEIEQEANELLAHLTNNQAHIIIESLRDLKKGGTKETLDIKISDPMGIRPYELFSGGEAFRIDFALRIAISKLLARRAGTSLQTLIIDEGFGSQDEDGVNHIMDALYKIQDHFAKIIIVSHLPIMKDHFPVHFFIEKGPHGSALQIVQH